MLPLRAADVVVARRLLLVSAGFTSRRQMKATATMVVYASTHIAFERRQATEAGDVPRRTAV